MKKFLLFACVAFFTLPALAQLNPITWTFSAKKIADKTYEIHMKATIQPNWHLYSQTQPGDAIAIPTKFSISANPLFTLDGKVKEIGKMEVFTDKTLGVSANQYSNSVVFVQKVKLKAKVKTNFKGNVEFQTCDDKKCLPPKKANFAVVLQ